MAQNTQEPVDLRIKIGGRTISMKFTGKDAEEAMHILSKLFYFGNAEESKDEPITSFRWISPEPQRKPLTKPFPIFSEKPETERNRHSARKSQSRAYRGW